MAADVPAASLERAELHLSLARAFLLPANAETFAGLREHLADDLEALCAALGYPAAAPIAEYREAIAALADADALSRLYSRLFLAPPRLAHLGSSAYLDGSAFGASMTALQRCYARCGVERADAFHNPSDHVSVQLEFLAYLYATGERTVAPEHFLDAFVRHWLPGFIRDLEQAQAGNNPYLALARVLAVVLERDAVPMPRDARELQRERALGRARAKRAAAGITAEDLKEIERRLKAKGLSTDHLADASTQGM